MAHVHGDRVLETTSGTTSPWTLAGAVAGHRAFSAVATADGDTFYYTIRLGTEWEVGLGTRSSVGVITRTTFIASSTGSAMTFSAGTKEVWMDIPARLLQMFTPSVNPLFVNGIVTEAHAANAVTFAVKTLAGANPSASDPVFFVFNDNGWTTSIRIVAAALSITVPSGATLGNVNAGTPRIWIAAMDNAGTVELVVRNCYDPVTQNIKWFSTDAFLTTTILNTASDSALVSYSTTARTDLSFIVLGYFTYNVTLAVAGTWDVAPIRSIAQSPHSPKAGDVIQTVKAVFDTETTATGNTTNFQNTTVTLSITPISFASVIRVTANGGSLLIQNALSAVNFRLRNTTASRTVGPDFQAEFYTSVAAQVSQTVALFGLDKHNSALAQTYVVQFYDSGFSGTFAKYSAQTNSATIIAEEIMC